MIEGKHIIVGVTGGIAAYKAAALVSLLKKRGADVHVCMTKNAQQFVSPLTFETLSVNRVVTDTFSREAPFEVEHVSLAKLADLIVVAPATANILAKAAQGLADDFLSTLLLAARSPVLFAPAMNTAMLHHPAVQRNLAQLRADGRLFVAPGTGMLACGDVGDGRMAEPEEIADAIEAALTPKDMQGMRLLVTAGPTRERLDDVRFLSNRSTGKMGYAIAAAAAARGAEVTLISGPVTLPPPFGVRCVSVESAQQMFEACWDAFPGVDIAVKAAAVADYTPAHYQAGKIKKSGDMLLELRRTRDILQTLGAKKTAAQVLVGFAAEAADLEQNAMGKLQRKNLDFIAANDISRSDIGFGSEQNLVTLFFADGSKKTLEKAEKRQVAHALLDEAMRIYQARH